MLYFYNFIFVEFINSVIPVVPNLLFDLMFGMARKAANNLTPKIINLKKCLLQILYGTLLFIRQKAH